METMKGILYYIQCGVFALVFLFTVIAFGAGVFWNQEHEGYKLSFTLWKICSEYGEYNLCATLKEDLLESVVVTVRVCMAISMLLMLPVAVFLVLLFLSQRNAQDDNWLVARTVLLLLAELFLLVSMAHAHHCPPCYFVDRHKIPSQLSWGWNMTLTSFVFLLIPCGAHLYEGVMMWRSERNKV